jgi:hypothetical protein
VATDVAVFGSSEPLPGEPLYETARAVGRLLATHGYGVVNGGYGGVMEGVSRGAREAGGRAIGVTSRDLGRSGGNAYLTEERLAENLFERTRLLMERSSAYIILAGKAGTLAEASFLWALHRARLLQGKPIVLLGSIWEGFVESLAERDLLEPGQVEATRRAATPEEAVRIILEEVPLR